MPADIDDLDPVVKQHPTNTNVFVGTPRHGMTRFFVFIETPRHGGGLSPEALAKEVTSNKKRGDAPFFISLRLLE